MAVRGWTSVSKASPCTICGKTSWCRANADETWALCRRLELPGSAAKMDKNGAPYFVYRNGESERPMPTFEVPKDPPRAAPETLDRAYHLLLGELTLSTAHADALAERGLSEDQITAAKYRTLPLRGRARIAKRVLVFLDAETLATVPGFYMKPDDEGDYWTLAGSPGLLIPVRDANGRIIALKIRADGNAEGDRYRYLSSTAKKGPGPGARPHIPLGSPTGATVARLTEGELKADVATALSDTTTVSVPGVSMWQLAIPVLRDLGIITVHLAFDADWRTNEHVRQALVAARDGLSDAGFEVRFELWEAELGKGIDDLLAAGHTPDVVPDVEELVCGVAGVGGVALSGEESEDPMPVGELRDRIKELRLDSEPTGLDLILALESDEVTRLIARQDFAYHRGLITELLETLSIDPTCDDAKSIRASVADQLRLVKEMRKDAKAAADDNSPEPTIVDKIVDLTADWDLFHDGSESGFATREVNGYLETFELSSSRAKNVLYHEFWKTYDVAVSASCIDEALRNIESRAIVDGARHDVHLRFAGTIDEVTYDLADDNYRAVVVSADGWELTQRPGPRFVRSSNTLSQVAPVPGGSIDQLWQFIRVKTDDMRRLLVAWLIGCFIPDAPRFGAIITGTQGTAKTVTTKMLRTITDPAKALTSRGPREEKDLAVKCAGNGVLAFDNLSRIPASTADVLCATLTGDGFEARKLYTDKDSVIFTFRRPLILNGIGGISNRPDLLDRCLAILLDPFGPGEKRRQERELWQEFHRALPELLGAVLDAVAGALREHRNVSVPDGIRMADAAVVGVAVERHLGWPPGSFAAAVARNDQIQTAQILGESLLVDPIDDLLASGSEWTGRAEELLKVLTARVTPQIARGKGWPKTPSALSEQLERLAPALGKAGTAVDRSYEHGGKKNITLRRLRDLERGTTPDCTSETTPTPPTPATPQGAAPEEAERGVAGVDGVAAPEGGAGGVPSRTRGIVA